MIKHIPAILGTFLFCFCSVVQAQSGKTGFPPLSFDRIKREAGLNNLAVSGIVQDRFGFLWLGTQNGLYRYDGTGFRVFEHDPFNINSLSHNLVQTLYLDEDNVLWIGTYQGLNRLDLDTLSFTRYENDTSDKLSLSNNIIVSIFKDHTDSLWVGTLDGLNRMDAGQSGFIRFMADPGSPGALRHKIVRAIAEDRDGRVWVGTSGGLHRYDRQKNSFVAYLPEAGRASSFPGLLCSQIRLDEKNDLWIASWDGGISKYLPEKDEFLNLRMKDKRFYSLLSPPGDFLYAGTWGNGLAIVDKKSLAWHFFEHDPQDDRSLSHNTVYSLFQDRLGLLWVGTNGGGLNKFNPRRLIFSSILHDPRNPSGLPSGRITAVYEDSKERLWVGTYNSGLSVRIKGSESFKHYRSSSAPGSLSDNIVNEILETKDGKLWFATNNGLNLFDEKTESFVAYFPGVSKNRGLPDQILYSLAEDAEGRLWIGTYTEGLVRWDRKNDTWDYFSIRSDAIKRLGSNLVYDLVFDERGRLWIATGKGLSLYDPRKQEVKTFFHDLQKPDSLSADSCRSLLIDSQKRLWVASLGGGLNLYRAETDTFEHFTRADGLASNSVLSVREDKNGKLWLGTQEGLTVFDTKKRLFRTYTDEEGLSDLELSPASFRLKNRDLLFGAQRGINIVGDFDFDDKASPPPVVITDVKVFNQERSFGKDYHLLEDISLEWNENNLSFAFAALDFTNPSKNIFSWKLEGFDKTWTTTVKQNYASYTNLPAGNYRFRVKAASPEGIWNEEGAQLLISVNQHLALRWWAILLYLLLAGFLATLVFRLRSAALLKTKVEELEKLRENLIEANLKLDLLSRQDELTRLPNRRFLEERMEQIWAEALRQELPVGLLMTDLDYFKAYNDYYGHPDGDEVLRKVGGLFNQFLARKSSRQNVEIGRYGGEEFVLVIAAVTQEELSQMAEELRSQVENLGLRHEKSETSRVVTLSVGLAWGMPSEGITLHSMLRQSDQALYRAKERGRNRVSA